MEVFRIFGLSTESMDLSIRLRTFVRAHFPENPRIRIFGFFVLKNEKKWVKKLHFDFHRKFENGSFLAKNGTKLAFLAQNAQKWGGF